MICVTLVNTDRQLLTGYTINLASLAENVAIFLVTVDSSIQPSRLADPDDLQCLKVIWCHVVYMTVLKMLKIMQAMQMITVISE